MAVYLLYVTQPMVSVVTPTSDTSALSYQYSTHIVKVTLFITMSVNIAPV